MVVRTYSELAKLLTFEERYRYLKLNGDVGAETFGFDRFMNQQFYTSGEWRALRDFVIVRDNGCDLGVEGYDIHGKIFIHHMNPITPKDIETRSEFLLDPQYLVAVSHNTHNAIHFGDEGLLAAAPVERSRNDTCPWKQI